MTGTRIIVNPGSKFACLTVVRDDGRLNERPAYEMLCDCGLTVRKEMRFFAKERKNCSNACGLKQPANLRHGAAIITPKQRTGAYRTWFAMRQRCLDPKSKSYHNYGGRGITICESWQNFAHFLADMGERPDGMTIDRKNVNGNYEPNNCRWATAGEQAKNRRKNTSG